ncbi:MAG: ROK family protein [Mycobacteriaceae bacterium]
MKAPSPEEIRQYNLSGLLKQVHLFGPVSRAELTEKMGLNRSTILALTSDLVSAGLVKEELPGQTGKAGRPSLVVSPETENVFVIALDVGADYLKIARVGLGGVIFNRSESSYPKGDFNSDTAIEALGKAIERTIALAPPKAMCVGVGVAFCGMVRSPDGLVRYGPNIGWIDVEVGTQLARQTGVHVAVSNNANLGALAEQERGAGIGISDLIYLHGEVGIGGGIISGGKLLGGASGYGGEVGHMTINPAGRQCMCGSRGCLEAEAGELALIAAAKKTDLTGRVAVEFIIDAANRGDAQSRDALHHVGEQLGCGIANLANIFNPAMIVFGGVLRDIYLASAAQVRSRLTENGLLATREQLKLRTSELADDAPLIGAAELAFAKLLNDPLHQFPTI